MKVIFPASDFVLCLKLPQMAILAIAIPAAGIRFKNWPQYLLTTGLAFCEPCEQAADDPEN
jgi:hypothetical protein